MACDFCNCLFLGCYDNCCDVPFIINNNPILATQTGTYTIQYIQEGSNTMVAAIDFTIGDDIKFPFSWFNFTGEVKFQLILPDNSVYEFNTYDCFSFQKVVTSTPSTSTSVTCNNVTVGEICTICDLLEALNIESQLLLEIRDINQTYLDTPLSEIGKETTLQAILTAIGGFGGAYALESTLQLVLTQLGNLGLDSTLQSILTALGTGLAQESTLQTVSKETTLQSVLTQLTTLNGTDFATETTLQAVETAINNLPAGGDATAANQVLEIAQLTSLNAKDFSTETTLQSVLAALLLSGQEITLQSILAALGPLATEVTLGQVLDALIDIVTYTISIESLMQSLNSKDFATQSTLQGILTQLDVPLSILDANIQNINLSIGTTNNELSNLNLKDFSTETTLQSVLAAISGLLSGDASAANQLLEIAELQAIKANQTNGTQIVNLITGYNLEVTQLLIKGVLDAIKLKTDNIDVALSTRLNTLGQKTAANSAPVVIASDQSAITINGTVTANAGTNLNTSLLALETTQVTQNANIGATNETAAATDTSTSGLNGLFKRLLQRITTLIGLFPTSLGQKTSVNSFAVTIASDQSTVPVSFSNNAASSTIAPITATTALSNGSQSLIIANSSRKALLIQNNTNRTVFVAYGGTANTTNNNSFTIAANSFEKVEIGANLAFSFSIVQASATGTINTTEIL